MQNIYVSVKVDTTRMRCGPWQWKIKNEKQLKLITIQIELIHVYVRLFMELYGIYI